MNSPLTADSIKTSVEKYYTQLIYDEENEVEHRLQVDINNEITDEENNSYDLEELTHAVKEIAEAAFNICTHTIETRCKGILVMRKLNELNEKQLTPPEGNNPHKFSFCFMSDDDYKAFNNVKTINGQVPRHSKLGYVLAYPDNIISTAKETGLFVPEKYWLTIVR